MAAREGNIEDKLERGERRSVLPTQPSLKVESYPLLDSLLARKGFEPFTLSTFAEFLEIERSEENLMFWVEVERLKAKGDSEDLVLFSKGQPVLPAYRAEPGKWMAEICTQFVMNGAPHEINISHNQKDSLLKAVKSSQVEPAPEIFNDAQNEVLGLMRRDAYPRFIKRFTTTNLNESERRYRYAMFFLMLSINILAIALMIHFALPRYYAFISIILWFGTFDYLLAARSKLCVSKAYFGLTLLERSTVCENRFTQFQHSPVCQVRLQDPLVIKSVRIRARRQLLVNFAIAVVLTLLTFALTFAFHPA